MIIKTKDTFEAAHKLDFLPPGHKCTNLHGHSYWVSVYVDGDDDDNGMLVEYGDVRAIIQSLDHKFLNEIVSNPTTENVARWLCRKIRAICPPDSYVRIRVKEGARKHTATCNSDMLDAEDALAEARARQGDEYLQGETVCPECGTTYVLRHDCIADPGDDEPTTTERGGDT